RRRRERPAARRPAGLPPRPRGAPPRARTPRSRAHPTRRRGRPRLMFDTFFFAVFPYLAVAIAVAGGIARYATDRFSYSSQSSQLLENRRLFWGSVLWHYAIILILLAHVAALAVSGAWGDLVANPARLYTLEVIGIALGLAAVLGLWVALGYRWGSDWYVHTVVPWLESLFKLEPDTQFITILPWVVKLHALGGFLLIALFPFTRLAHIVTVPITYLWRPYQVVIWNRRRTTAGAATNPE